MKEEQEGPSVEEKQGREMGFKGGDEKRDEGEAEACDVDGIFIET